MPAATTTATTIAPEPPQPQAWYRPAGDKHMEPFSSSITAAEHKIRNLEKRKQKLDQYRTEQSDGKTLNSDQLAAVAKYNEVIQQLEHNRELVSCLKQVHQQTIKFIKQELRREYAERNKFMLSLQAGLDQLQNPKVQHDFLLGENGAQKLSQEDLTELTELSKLLKPTLREPDFVSKVEAGAEIVSKLFESRGKINNKPSQHMKTLIDSVVDSQYFTSGLVSSVPIDAVVDEVTQRSQESLNPVHVPEIPMDNNQVSAQMMIPEREGPYSFIQESQLEIESPHMDPAVVAVSQFAPPMQPIQSHPDTNHIFNSAPGETLNSIQSGMRDLNLNHVNSNNVEEEEEWEDSKNQTGAYNNSSSMNGNMDGGDQDNTNGFDRSGRGSFRGRGSGGRSRGGRGSSYGNGGRPPKDGRSRGGFNNHRGGGYFRGQPETEMGEFRGNKRGFTRSLRGNGNAPMSSGGAPRRARGPPKPFNGTHDSNRSSE